MSFYKGSKKKKKRPPVKTTQITTTTKTEAPDDSDYSNQVEDDLVNECADPLACDENATCTDLKDGYSYGVLKNRENLKIPRNIGQELKFLPTIEIVVKN